MSSGKDLQVLLAALLICILNSETCSSQVVNTTSTTNDSLDDYNSDYSDLPVNYENYAQLCDKTLNRQFRAWFMPTFYTVICFLGLVGNLLVIVTFFYFKRLKTMTDVYLLNLSFADLLFTLSLPFWAANSMAKWTLGVIVCTAMHAIYKVSFYSGMLLLSLISMDRYFAIAKPVSAHRHRSRTVAFSKASSTAIWLLALVFSVPEMMYSTVSHGTCTPYPAGNSDRLRVGIQSCQMVLGFAVPLLVIGFCYTAIVRTLCQARNFERNKAIKVIFAVVTVFLFCQVPYNIVLLLTTLDAASKDDKNCSYDNSLLYATDVTQCVAFWRCCLNPFVYAFVGVKFRNDVLKLLKHLGCVSQQRFFKYTSGRTRSSVAPDTETTTSFSP